jgi:hypothetical protein
MTDALSLRESLGKELADPKLKGQDLGWVDQHLPSYFRSLRNFSGRRLEQTKPGVLGQLTYAGIDFLSKTTHVTTV